MHIPDGYLSPQTYVVLDAVMVPIWLIAARKVKRTLKARQIPLMALGAAFAFVIMMFNVPVIGGSTGHAVGATLIAIILGPWAAVIAISIAVVIQAGLFGDGGITTIGANCFTMAVVAPFVGYYLYRLVAGDAPSPRRRVAASGAASYVALVAAAIVAGVLLGIQPYLAHAASGQALYAPYRLGVAVPAMALEHLLFFGWIEAFVTMGVVASLARSEPRLLEMKPAARPLRWLWGGLAALILLTPIGALAPGTAWGEWSSAQLRSSIGYAPANLARLGSVWRAAMPRYATPGVSNAFLGYLIAARVGVALTVGVALAVGLLIARRETTEARPAAADGAASDRRPGLAGRGGRSLARKTADSIAGAVTDVLHNEDVAARPGLLQRLDPRVKLLTLVLFAVTASLVHSIAVLVALVGVTLVLAAASHVGLASFERKVWASAGLLALLIALPSALRVFTPGAVAVSLGPATLTQPGLLGVATLVTRVVAAAGFALLVVWTMRWRDLLHALTAMHMPDVVVATLAMTQKQILTLLRTVEQIHLARESRTLTRGTARRERDWVTERMAFVVRKSMKTADDVHDAMLARGFSGAAPALVRLRVRRADWLWSLASVALCVLALTADRLLSSL
jgi:cobalt/nickel transport system permease protein